MKIKLLLFILLCKFSVVAQVGVGTINPTADLHIAGESSTIRVEGLNLNNDPLNNAGIDSRVKVFIDPEGELTLQNSADNTQSLNFLIDSSDNLSQATVINHAGDSIPVVHSIYSPTINVESDCYLEIKYNFSYQIFETYNEANQNNTKITDGEARVVKTYFTINDDPEQYGQISQIYYNIGDLGASGYFFNNGYGYVFLPNGVHTIKFHSEINSYSDAVLVFGGNSDSLKIRMYQ